MRAPLLSFPRAPDLPAAPARACPQADRPDAAQAGQRERNPTAKAVSIPAAMQWPRAGVTSSSRTPHCRHSPARRLRFCHSCARCSFLSPSPLGGRGKGEGGCWRHLEPLGASPLCLRLRLRGASPPLLDPLPRWGRGIRKRGCVPQFCHPRAPHCRHSRAPHCRHSRARLTCLPRLPVRARRQTGRTRRRQANGSAMPRRRPSPSPLPCNGHAREGKKKARRARG